MAKILKFDPSQRGKRVSAAVATPCQIILFTGVHYEHAETRQKRKKIRSSSSSPKARRRKA